MAFGALLMVALAATGDLQGSLAAVRAVGPEGKGSPAAARAWREWSQADVAQLPQLLAGMDGANPLARNWLRSAIDQVLDRAKASGKPLPIPALEQFLLDTKHNPQARRLAYELIV